MVKATTHRLEESIIIQAYDPDDDLPVDGRVIYTVSDDLWERYE